jgi:hypothetical protein
MPRPTAVVTVDLAENNQWRALPEPLGSLVSDEFPWETG